MSTLAFPLLDRVHSRVSALGPRPLSRFRSWIVTTLAFPLLDRVHSGVSALGSCPLSRFRFWIASTLAFPLLDRCPLSHFRSRIASTLAFPLLGRVHFRVSAFGSCLLSRSRSRIVSTLAFPLLYRVRRSVPERAKTCPAVPGSREGGKLVAPFPLLDRFHSRVSALGSRPLTRFRSRIVSALAFPLLGRVHSRLKLRQSGFRNRLCLE